MKRQPLLLCAFALLLCASLPAQNRKAAPLVFTPQWTAQAQFAGYYVAKEKGFYDEEGVDVVITHPNVTQSAIDRIRADRSHATTLQLVQAMKIMDEGIPLVNLLQTSMNSAFEFISRREVNPVGQKGAKVAVWTGFTDMVKAVAQDLNMDCQWIPAASSVALFVAGAVDASAAMTYNEHYQIRQAGFILEETAIFRFGENGYNIQEDGLYVTRDYYNKHKDQADKFARASRRGWEYAATHPEEALDIVMAYVDRNHIATNRILQQLMLKEILKLQLDPDSGVRAFTLRPDMVQQACDLLLRCGIIRKPVTLTDLSR
ncbi:MAG: ABC transporter substrate-binding protein [Bacteroidales bacterium]|nr:ABC transporter substrate-binding protein [Bacteroidales bacterium]